MRQLLFETLLILGISAVLALMVNHFSPNGIPLKGQWEKSRGVISAKVLAKQIEINDPQRVRQMVEQKTRVILDARGREEYEQGHIPGALSFPLRELDEMFGVLARLVDRSAPILVYCSGVECEDSHTVAEYLTGFGYTDVKVYGGGFTQWEEMGFDIETGA